MITDKGARALADCIRANKSNGGKLKEITFLRVPKITDAGMQAMAEAMHATGHKAGLNTPDKVKTAMAALTKQDNAESIDLSEANAKIKSELRKREFTEQAIAFRNDM